MIVIAALAMVVIIGMVGLIIDGGAVFAQQRVAQNAADAASTAGTLIVAENLGSLTNIRNQHDVFVAVSAMAAKNGLGGLTAVYTDDIGQPIGVDVTDTALAIPDSARGVRVGGQRIVSTTFSGVLGFTTLTASAEATVVAGKASGECVVDEDGCTLLPLTFPVQVSECDSSGNLIPGDWIGAPPPGPNAGDPYWPLVGQESLPSTANPTGDTTKMAILPLCKHSSGGSGAFGWLDLDPNIPNLAGEINGPLTVVVDIPDWFQEQPGNPNSVDDELSQYIGSTVLIPLNNGACRVDPAPSAICPQAGSDPVGNNTWYYVHTLANFYLQQVNVQGSNTSACSNPPGSPTVPTTGGTGFLGCIKGWFVNYVTSGPIVPGGDINRGHTSIAIQLIK